MELNFKTFQLHSLSILQPNLSPKQPLMQSNMQKDNNKKKKADYGSRLRVHIKTCNSQDTQKIKLVKIIF